MLNPKCAYAEKKLKRLNVCLRNEKKKNELKQLLIHACFYQRMT